MVDITHKSNTLREATAMAVVNVGDHKTVKLIENRQVPKGDVFEMSRAAGLLGVKKTPDLLPDCHPLPIEYTGVSYEIDGLTITIKFTVKTIYKTGVEVEAMHGASIVALNMYDMLKPVDKNIHIGTIKLLKKTGGKSSHNKVDTSGLTAKVVVCSNASSSVEKQDGAGNLIVARLDELGIESQYVVIPGQKDQIEDHLFHLEQDMIIYTGGTSANPRDITPDVLRPQLDTILHGVEEQMRSYGQQRTPYTMLSRSVAGIRNGKVVLAIPESADGVNDSLNAVFPHIFHVFHILKGGGH